MNQNHNELAILNQNLQYPTLAVALQQAALRSSFAALRNSLRTALSAAPTMEEVHLMDWGASSTIEEGSAEVHETELDTMRAAVDLPGGGVQRQGEPGVEYPWRCGALRTAALAATPLLQRAVGAGAAHCWATTLASTGPWGAALFRTGAGTHGAPVGTFPVNFERVGTIAGAHQTR